MNFKTAAIIGVVLLAIILVAALFYNHNNQIENASYGSAGSDRSHYGGGWVFWDSGGWSQHGSQDIPDQANLEDKADAEPTTSIGDFYGSDKSGEGTSGETSFKDFYSDSDGKDGGTDATFADFYSDSGSDDWSDSGDWGDSGDSGGDDGGDW